MKNSKLRRIVMLLACAVLLVSLSVGATLAYLTSTTGTVKNTFTVGSVNIKLDEAKVDEYGKPEGSTRTTTGNAYKLLPGHTYTKDPTVTVESGSEKCYVRIQVTVDQLDSLKAAFPQTIYPTYYAGDVFLLQNLVNGWDNKTWLFNSFSGSTYEFWYKDVVDAGEAEVKLDALFDSITIPGEVSEKQLAHMDKVDINIVAHAIQADGFNAAADAWAQWGKTNTTVTGPAVDTPAENQ